MIFAVMFLKISSPSTPVILSVTIGVLLWTGFMVPSILIKGEHYANNPTVTSFKIFAEFFGFWIIMALVMMMVALLLATVKSGSLLGTLALLGIVLTLFVIHSQRPKAKAKPISRYSKVTRRDKLLFVSKPKAPKIANTINQNGVFDSISYQVFCERFSARERAIFNNITRRYYWDLTSSLYWISPSDFDKHWMKITINEALKKYSDGSNQLLPRKSENNAADFIVFQILKRHPAKFKICETALRALEKLQTAQPMHKARLDSLVHTYKTLTPHHTRH